MRKDRPWYYHREEIREALNNLSFSEHFGWTPKRTREELTDEEILSYKCLMSGNSSTKK